MPHDPRTEHLVPEGLTEKEYARLGAQTALDMSFQFGSVAREMGNLVRRVANIETEMHEFKSDSREGFRQLGVRLDKRIAKTEKKVHDLEDDFEDTKTRDLRAYKRRYMWWRKTALSGIIATVVGIASILIAHYVFHVG
jgi:cell division protein FtsB